MMSNSIGKALRGFVYWFLTKGPIGVTTGVLFKHRAFDGLGSVAVPLATKAATIGAIIYGVYEYPERVLIKRWLPSNLDCIELGCSIGVISRVILQKLEPKRRLIAVEASDELLTLAKRNSATAGFSSRFMPVHAAIHYDGDTVVFARHAEHIRGKIAKSAQGEGSTTPCATLAQVIRKSGLGSYSLVMDIEGSEFDLIAKDSANLSGCQVIIVELHGDESAKNAFINKLTQVGLVLAESKHSVFAFVRRL